MRVDLFDFELPDDRVALRPARPRDSARLMVVEPETAVRHLHVGDLPGLLRAGDVLVVNDTKVIPAALRGVRTRDETSASVSVTLIQRIDDANWWALAKPAKRLEPGDRISFGAENTNACFLGGLDATIATKLDDGRVRLAFDLSGTILDEAIGAVGHVPLPPYIGARRAEDEADRTDYQTMFADAEGAVAAPTAGLHFTPELSSRLEARGVATRSVTLHVGPGTFLPVKADDTENHTMHAEWGTVSAATAAFLNEARAAGGRIVAVGTTTLRLLESAADETGTIRPFAAETDIFIKPGYRFRAADILMTNFHLPRSTLLMLVSAFSGRERMLSAYKVAIAAGYRFYSYGDACLLFPEPVVG